MDSLPSLYLLLWLQLALVTPLLVVANFASGVKVGFSPRTLSRVSKLGNIFLSRPVSLEHSFTFL